MARIVADTALVMLEESLVSATFEIFECMNASPNKGGVKSMFQLELSYIF